jgi:hypothetical protein
MPLGEAARHPTTTNPAQQHLGVRPGVPSPGPPRGAATAPAPRCLPRGGELRAVPWGRGRQAPGSRQWRALGPSRRPAPCPPRGRRASRAPQLSVRVRVRVRAPRPTSPEPLSSPRAFPRPRAGWGAPPDWARSAADRAPPRRAARTRAGHTASPIPAWPPPPAAARPRACSAAPAPGPTPTCAPGGSRAPPPLFFPLFA